MKKRSCKTRKAGDVHSFNRIILEIDVNGFVTDEADDRIDRALAALLHVRGGSDETSCVGLDCNGYKNG